MWRELPLDSATASQIAQFEVPNLSTRRGFGLSGTPHADPELMVASIGTTGVMYGATTDKPAA